jgi:hypothetical protein
VAKNWRWHKRRFYEGGTNVVLKKVALTSFFICRWHLCRFLPIGGTNVDLIEGGTNVAVGVAKTSLGKNVGSTKVAPPINGHENLATAGYRNPNRPRRYH